MITFKLNIALDFSLDSSIIGKVFSSMRNFFPNKSLSLNRSSSAGGTGESDDPPSPTLPDEDDE